MHNRHCRSKCIWPAATASASYGQLCAGCMISAHAELGTAQVAGGIEAAARCGRGRCPSRRWLEHAHWPRSCCHMFKARVLCCNASSKWVVSGRDSQLQRNDHGSDRSWMARVLCCNASSKWAVSGRDRQPITAVIAAGWHAQLLPPTSSLPTSSFLYSSFLSNLSILCIFSLCPSLNVAFVQGLFEGVESASHPGWMSHAPPSQAKRGCGAGALTLAISKGPAISRGHVHVHVHGNVVKNQFSYA